MHIPASTLENLSSIGIFRPNGLNDDIRVDLTNEEPFIAVDKPQPEEIDDAIRVRRTKTSGFVAEVAVAEGAQIRGRDDLLDNVWAVGSNDYSSRDLPRILPPTVLRQLELTSTGPKRAMVIRQVCDSSLAPIGNVDILPALIRTRTLRFAEFAGQMAMGAFPAITSYSLEAGIISPQSLKPKPFGVSAFNIGSNVVQHFMISANLGLTAWSKERNVALVRRVYTQHKGSVPAFASFAAEEGLHDSVIQGRAFPYGGGTSPLRRADHLLNHFQIGTQLATDGALYSQEELSGYVQRMNDHLAELRRQKYNSSSSATAVS